MNPLLKEKVMAEYPDWHYKPLRLTIAEMENPYKVINSFFGRYNLPQIRACLKDMLFDAIWMDDNAAPEHISTQDDLEKLIEATWVLRSKNNKELSLNIQIQKAQGKALANEYRDIQEFFDSITLPKALEYLKSTFRSAEAMEVWKMSTPNDLLNFFESLGSLLKCVYRIAEKKKIIEGVVLNKKGSNPSLNDSFLYCANYDQLTPWDYFPRLLTKKEFRDPYKVFGRFTQEREIKEWQEILEYLLNAALSKNSLTEVGVHLEIFSISEHLQKLIEACHLIYVRLSHTTSAV